MKIKAFGMDIQVTEESVFVNGKEVYNKIDQEFGDNDRPMTKLNFSNMHNYSSVSSLIEPKDEGDKEQRMNVIGQNGNDGLHYGVWKDAMIEQINRDLMNKDRNLDVWDSDH